MGGTKNTHAYRRAGEPLRRALPRPELRALLELDCAGCCGLCCTALYFAASEGFPADKDAGKPCLFLAGDYRCSIHAELPRRRMKGCMAFHCLGAGPAVRAVHGGKTWRESEDREGYFQSYHLLRRLRQDLWYLTETLCLLPARPVWAQAEELIGENLRLCALAPGALTNAAAEAHGARINPLLHRAAELAGRAAGGGGRQRMDCVGRSFRGKRLEGADFSTCLLLAADLRDCSLRGCNFLGADLRDARLEGADLRESFFLTQAQLNTARGDGATRLPDLLARPDVWKERSV